MLMTVTVEYVWIGGTEDNWSLRSKTRVLPQYDLRSELKVSDLPNWNYDGSSTGQAEGKRSEVTIKPRALFQHPFRDNGCIVMCDTYDQTGEPLPNNFRCFAEDIFNRNPSAQPWFGLEQEYFLIDPETDRPLGFAHGPPAPQGQYYCSVGAANAFGRKIVDQHLDACIRAGVKISGVNAEVAPGQWEFQVGPCTGIEAGDHVWIARYLLDLVAEQHGVVVNYEPKPVTGNWNGSGCHTNYSTQEMRENGGLEHIYTAIDRLAEKHAEHMTVYGKGNEQRMTGLHETASFDTFDSGVGNRGASVRIGQDVVNRGKGYFEDRRPSSNCDPYRVTSKIFETTVPPMYQHISYDL